MSLREDGALRIVKRHALYAAGAGLIPLPVFDLAAITGVQAKMLKDLAAYYQIPFKEDVGKSLISSLLGAIVSTRLTYGIAGSFIKGIPIVGTVLGMVTAPGFASASTYAVGKVFIQHFASGGTFLDFDPDKVKKHFAAEYQGAAASGVAAPTATEQALGA